MAKLHEKEFLKAYDELSDPLFRYCYLRLFNRARAKEIMQETFTRTWEYLGKGSSIDNMKAFLYRTARNLIIDDVRRRKESSLDELAEHGFDPGRDESGQFENLIEARKAKEIFSKLDPDYRDVIVMRYVEELSPKEIGDILNETENAVSVRIHRGLKKLKELLTP